MGGAVVVLISINSLLSVAYLLLRNEASIYDQAQQFPEIVGIDLSGQLRFIRNAPCYVVRVTRDNCPYCQSDQPAYEAFLEVARNEAACAIVEVSPTAGQMQAHSRNGITQLEMVHMELGRTLWPNLTPQTLVLNGDRRLQWSRMGAFDNRAMASGLLALRDLEQ